MDLILQLFHAYSMVNDATRIGSNVADWVTETVNGWSRKKSTANIEDEVAEIATLTENDIRRGAKKAFAGRPGPIMPSPQREEMIGMMINMARNVRTQAAYGSLASVGSFMRGERLLDMLIGDIQPVRHINEAVAPNSPWKLRRHLGMGSFGEVWLAQNPDFPTPRAYKFFTKDGTGEWLRREQTSLVKILESLGEHEQIVDFEDVDTKCDHPFLAFEYMAGGSLEEWILKRADERPRLEATEIVRQVAVGLAAAHNQSIQHRDIKPANILLTGGNDPQIKIGDFGLAKVAASTGGLPRPEASALASLVGIVGTQLYLPPESQQRSFRRKAAQDDVFALGVVWYQLLIGAIERPSYDFADRLTKAGVDSQTIRIIERCLAHPDRRYKDADELLKAIVGNEIPAIIPAAPGVPDVQYLAREYLAGTMVNSA